MDKEPDKLAYHANPTNQLIRPHNYLSLVVRSGRRLLTSHSEIVLIEQ